MGTKLFEPLPAVDKVVPPLKYSIKTILKTNGSITFNCPGTLYNTACYFVIKHRNSLETWSAAPQLLNGPTYTYDFTTGISKSYGNNMVLNGGKYCLFSGDINQDGVIESTDFGDVENKSQLFLFGYQVDDLTGDNLVESSDYGLIENNSQLFLFSQRP